MRALLILLCLLYLIPGVRAQCTPDWQPGAHVPGIDGTVYALHPLPNGDLIAAGQFTCAGNIIARDIARWNGATWFSVGGGTGGNPESTSIAALLTLPNGDLIVGGKFLEIGGIAASCIARWDGSAWSPLGSGMSIPASASPHVSAMAVLPNGDLVAAGEFTTAGGVNANRIARWDGSVWSPLGSGLGDFVSSLAVLPGGDLIAAGAFETAGGVPARYIARWNGSVWSAFDQSAFNQYIHNLAVMPNGDLMAGGLFTTIGAVSANRIARWNGTSWAPLGTGLTGTSLIDVPVYALQVLPNGDLIVGGKFTAAGGTAASGIARWNGSSWSALGSGLSAQWAVYEYVGALALLPNGRLIAGGSFSATGGTISRSIASWDGSAWSPFDSGTEGQVWALANTPGGDLVAGGSFSMIEGASAHNIARWNGVEWSQLGPGFDNGVSALITLPSGDLIAGGDFTGAGTVPLKYIARWDGSAWAPLGEGFNGPVWCLAVLPNGSVIAGGQFTMSAGVPVNRLARWDGSSWSALGTGMTNFFGDACRVYAVTALPGGDIVAGGIFRFAGGVPANNIARWNGSTWSSLGSGISNEVYALATLPGGDLAVGGYIYSAGGLLTRGIARWNGASWSSFGSGVDADVYSLAIHPGGDLIATGCFRAAGGASAMNAARWNASTWSPLGEGLSGGRDNEGTVNAVLIRPNGDLVVGGSFTIAGSHVSASLARWSDHACYANCDCSATSPQLNIADFICFLNHFAAADPYANCDNSITPPALNVSDFTCFLTKYAAGCP